MLLLLLEPVIIKFRQLRRILPSLRMELGRERVTSLKKKILLLLAIFLSIIMPTDQHAETRDIIIYGGGFAGCAAARNAAAAAPEACVLLIIPERVWLPGGLGTVGGQNFADIRLWKGELVTQGSFGRWYAAGGQFYNTGNMANIIAADLHQFANLEIMYGWDVRNLSLRKESVNKVMLNPVQSDKQGILRWLPKEKRVKASVFIDASDDGRMVRLADVPHANGRQDWPRSYLPPEEQERARQQAATLMFKVKGIQVPEQPGPIGDWYFSRDAWGSWGLAGGQETWQNNPVVRAFNEKYRDRGFAIKPINAAQDGAGSQEWWVNALLVFNVDGTFHERDRGTKLFIKAAGHEEMRTVDQAWQEARDFLDEPDFLTALQQFAVRKAGRDYGFKGVELVRDEKGQPVVGRVMYIRETVHSLKEPLTNPQGRENDLYELTSREAQAAGSSYHEGADAGHYRDRIGLGYYMMDINAYLPEDLTVTGAYRWPVTRWLRPDWWEAGGEPVNPVYLPYSMLTVPTVKNLLVPGYATGCSAFAWAELRVLPNLAVLGDAAGVAAARAVLFHEEPRDFETPQIEWIQQTLLSLGARLDK